jgi:hypothetical protein
MRKDGLMENTQTWEVRKAFITFASVCEEHVTAWGKFLLKDTSLHLWNQKFYYHFHTKPKLDHNLSKMYLAHTLAQPFFKIHFNYPPIDI